MYLFSQVYECCLTVLPILFQISLDPVTGNNVQDIQKSPTKKKIIL